MSHPALDLERIREEFDGVARLFPLPSLVVFPDALVPLKIFEPRYVTMVNEALEGDGLIAMALLKPGWEPDYNGNPPIHPMLCLGKILQHRRLPNDHLDVWLYGVDRARILEEIPSEPFRRARVERVDDVEAEAARPDVAERLRRTLELVPGRRTVMAELRRMAGQVRGVDASPGRYADAVACVSDLPPAERYEILEEVDVLARFQRLIERLEQRARADAPRAVIPKDVLLN